MIATSFLDFMVGMNAVETEEEEIGEEVEDLITLLFKHLLNQIERES